jgi:hypothetical protein
MYQRSYSVINRRRSLWGDQQLVKFILLQNVPILQNAIAFKSNHSNTMLPNVMVLAPLQKLKIKYELSYQSTTKLMYQRSYSAINRRRSLWGDQQLVKFINIFQFGSRLVRQFIFNLQLL